MRARALILAILILAGLPAAGEAAPAEPVPAAQVGYFTTVVEGGLIYHLECTAHSTIADYAIIRAVEFSHGSVIAGSVVHPRTSSTGDTLQVHDRRLAGSTERVEDQPALVTRFTHGEALGTGERTGFYLAWAVWGGEVDCTLSINWQQVSIRWVDGSHGIYVSPEAFKGGVFYQDGKHQRAEGRVFERALPGGPVLAALHAEGSALIFFDHLTLGWFPRLCTGRQICDFAAPMASAAVVEISGGNTDGDPVSQLWLITLPPEAGDEVRAALRVPSG